MQRRMFITGSLLAAATTAAAVWRARADVSSGGGPRPRLAGEPLPDGRMLVRGAALAFGTTVSMAAVHEDPQRALAAIREALEETRRIDALMTVFRPESQVSRLNATGELSHPDPHLVRVLEFSQRLAALSDGSFDPTVQPLWSLFVACAREGRLPARDEIARARSLVGWTALEVSPRRIALGRPGMSITLNGIAQGYAADVASAVLRERGIADALIDTGEWGAAGSRQPRRPWTVGIQHPRDPAALLGAVAMDGRFLATSGDYATPFSTDRRYHHVFDPHTGVSPPRLSSAVVAAATGLEADGLTKPMMVLDQARAQALLSRFRGAGAVWVGKDGRILASRGIRLVAIALLLLVARAALASGGTVTGKVDVQPARFQDETVVYLKDVAGTHAPATHTIDQKGMKFLPFMLVVAAGDSVEFLNHDGVAHNVYSPDGEAFNLGTFASADKRTHTFPSPGVYRILCAIHPEMLGYVFVAENPHAAAVDRKGRFRLADVPPGTYRLAVWNAHLSGPEKTITVGDGETVEQTLAVAR